MISWCKKTVFASIIAAHNLIGISGINIAAPGVCKKPCTNLWHPIKMRYKNQNNTVWQISTNTLIYGDLHCVARYSQMGNYRSIITNNKWIDYDGDITKCVPQQCCLACNCIKDNLLSPHSINYYLHIIVILLLKVYWTMADWLSHPFQKSWSQKGRKMDLASAWIFNLLNWLVEICRIGDIDSY